MLQLNVLQSVAALDYVKCVAKVKAGTGYFLF
jgi:hypothetical protein